MQEFPPNLRVENKKNFEKISYERFKTYLRKNLYEHILSREETDYFVFEDFNKKWVRNIEKTRKMIEEIRKELHDLGWKTATGFGNTGLFIYSDKKPHNCYEDAF